MPAPSLSAMAQNAAIRNIGSITDIADLPYHAVEPILRRIDNPQQLRDIEVACPHIAENSGPIWQEFIKRDVSKGESKMLYPKDPKNWWKVYRKMVKQEAADKEAAEEGLKQAMMGLQEAKGAKQTEYVPKVFSLGQKKKTGFFDGVRHGGGGGGKAPMLWNAKTGRDAFGAMQRATASKVKVFKPGTRHYIPDAKSQIKVAPKSMIADNSGQEAVRRAAAEAKKYAEPSSQRPLAFVPMSTASKAEQAFRNEDAKAQFEKERRLRALTARSGTQSAPSPGQARSTTAAGTQRTTAQAAPKRHAEATFSPSPPPSSAANNSSQPQKPAPVKRKRPAADPFLSAKRSRP